jgi:hypothetical protein
VGWGFPKGVEKRDLWANFKVSYFDYPCDELPTFLKKPKNEGEKYDRLSFPWNRE